nr:MAG TPA: hypothetical protein [Caudoviricetes sp.]
MSWWQAGQPSFPWAEAKALVLDALADASTALGAEHAGWEYPARTVDLLIVNALLGEDASKVMPYQENASAEEPTSQSEVAAALAALEESIIIAN